MKFSPLGWWLGLKKFRVPPVPQRIGWSIAAIWVCFLIRASFYCAVMPLWEGWDEYAHFDYVRHVALKEELPGKKSLISGEVGESLRLAPLPWTLKDYFTDIPHLSHDAYWRLPEQYRRELQGKLAALGNDRAAWQESGSLTQYEAQHPPGYYVLIAGAYELVRGQPLTNRVYSLRLVSVALGSLVVPCTYMLGHAVFRNPAYGIGAASVVTAMPGVMMTLARVSNEALAIVLGGAALAAMAASKRNPVVVGTILGLGLLTKAYFLTVGLAVFAWLATEAWRRRSGVTWRKLLLVASFAAAIAGWWYWETWRMTGSLSGEEHDVAFRPLGFGDWRRTALHVDWRRALDANFCTHIWAGGWSYLAVRGWMYHAFALLAVAGAAGTTWVFIRRKGRRATCVVADLSAACMTIVFLGAFAVGLAYHAVTIYAAHGISAVNGWYIDCLVAGEVVLWALGLMAFLPQARRAWAFPLLSVAFLALDVFAMHIYLLPYYAGFIAHSQGNHLPALKLGRLTGGEWHVLLERLAVNKPTWLTAHGIAELWGAYMLASCATAIIAWKTARRAPCLPDRTELETDQS
jgi:hypothetical protein